MVIMDFVNLKYKYNIKHLLYLLLNIRYKIYDMNIIGLTGKKRSGKDTVADHLVAKYGFIKLSFAGPLKEACKTLFQFTDEQVHTDKKEEPDEFWNVSPRVVLQFIGTDVFRNQMSEIIPNIEGNFWVTLAEKRCIELVKQNKDVKIVISDVRFQNEAEMINRLGGKVIKIIRPSLNSVDEHISETGIDSINIIDYNIVNDNTIDEMLDHIDIIMK